MTTSISKGFEAYCLLPVAAQFLQESTIADLQKKVVDLQKNISDLETKKHSADGLEGKGDGNGLGVPTDDGKHPSGEVGNIVPEGASSSVGDYEEIFSQPFKKGRLDYDTSLPETLPKNPPTDALKKFVYGAKDLIDGVHKTATKAKPYVDAGFKLADLLRGGASEDTDSGESDDDLEPYYVGDLYKKKVRFL